LCHDVIHIPLVFGSVLFSYFVSYSQISGNSSIHFKFLVA